MTQALQTLLAHAERERDQARASLLRAEQASGRLHQQWQQLQAYRADFDKRSPGLGGRAAPIELLRCHQAFALRLDQALAQQAALMQTADTQLQQLRQQLLARETRVASVRKLMERRHHEQQHHVARQEQKRSDEATAQRRWRDSSHADSRSVTH